MKSFIFPERSEGDFTSNNKEKTSFFVRLSVCVSIFLILSYFSKDIIVTQKIIIELCLKNSKEGNWKEKIVDKIRELFLNE